MGLNILIDSESKECVCTFSSSKKIIVNNIALVESEVSEMILLNIAILLWLFILLQPIQNIRQNLYLFVL
jgi:hypothetical protein